MTRWPAMMRKATAAEYCDLSEASFVREVAAGRLPQGVTFGGREHWRKDSIDAALALLDRNAQVPEYRRRLMERHGKAA